MRHFLLILLAAAATAAAPVQAQTGAPDPARSVGPITRPAIAGKSAADIQARRVESAPTPTEVTLPALSRQKTLELTTARTRPGTPRRIGYGRDIPELSTAAATANFLRWQDAPGGGKFAATNITATGALGLRVGIEVTRLPAGAVFRVYAPGSGAARQVAGETMLAAIERNLAAGDNPPQARTYWLPFVAGDRITIEVELPAGVGTDEIEIAVPRISHYFATPLSAAGKASTGVGAAAGCERDAVCSGDWSDIANATAVMDYIDSIDHNAYLCTGTLLNNQANNLIPYFLGAYHCIADQTTASTLETYWFYQSTACNSGVLNPNYKTVTGGATLLYASSTTDTSFMKLNGSPPAGAVHAGWSVSVPSAGTAVTALHHPLGDMTKITSGSVDSYLDCTPIDANGFFTCTAQAQADAEYLHVRYSAGVTEPGSSGAGLFITSAGTHYLVGTLYGGTSECGTSDNTDEYGRFDIPYNKALSQWLGGMKVSQFASRATVTPSAPVYGGFALDVATNLYIAVRGPSLGTLGIVPNFHPHPQLTLYDAAGNPLATSNQCNGATPDNAAVVNYYQNIRHAPMAANDACLGYVSAPLAAGVYTFRIVPDPSAASSSGEVLFETTPVSAVPLGQFASRATVTPSAPVYGGFAVEGPTSLYIAVRGPSLATLGIVPNPLPRPQLTLYDGAGNQLQASNKCDSSTTDKAAVVSYYQNTRHAALNGNDACLGYFTAPLNAGVYTFRIVPDAAAANGTGEVLFETQPVR